MAGKGKVIDPIEALRRQLAIDHPEKHGRSRKPPRVALGGGMSAAQAEYSAFVARHPNLTDAQIRSMRSLLASGAVNTLDQAYARCRGAKA